MGAYTDEEWAAFLDDGRPDGVYAWMRGYRARKRREPTADQLRDWVTTLRNVQGNLSQLLNLNEMVRYFRGMQS